MFEATSVDLSDYERINPYFTKIQLAIVMKELLRIKALLPKTGSLKYGYQTAYIKTEIDKAVLKIISCSKDFKKAYDKYIQSSIDIRKIYDLAVAGSDSSNNPSSLDDAKNDAVKNLNKSVGNEILKAVKAFKKIEAKTESSNDTKQSQESEKAQKKAISNLITQIAFSLSRGANSNKAKVHTIVHDDLSKQAKIELAKKMENKGIDWGIWHKFKTNVPQSLVFLRNVSKRAKKHEAGIAIISHSLVDFLDPSVRMYGQPLLDVPSYKIVMGCDGKDLDDITQLYNLTDTEYELVHSKKRGNALMFIGSKRLHVWFLVPDYKLALIGRGGGR
jgi:hypothetical protein